MDTELVVRAQQGDQQAFASLAGAVSERLHGVAYGILRDRQLAEDATQQAVLLVWRDLPRLRDPERFEAWSYRLLVNTCHTVARRERRWLPGMQMTDDEPAGSDQLGMVHDRDQLERGLRRLSVDQRAVVVLSFFVDLRPDQVAEALGVPVGTVHSRLHRAMRALRAALDADDRPLAAEQARPEAMR